MNHAVSEPARVTGRSLRDFWTDGSVSRLCAQIEAISGVPVELRDEDGAVLDPDLNAIATIEQRPIPTGSSVYPVTVSDAVIGSVVIPPGDPSSGARATVERIGELIGTVTQEMCADVSELRVRIKEIEVHYRLNALLVGGGRVEDTLELALSAALEMLALDAGAIMLLPEGAEDVGIRDREDELERTVSSGLSESWLGNPLPLSHDRAFDRACLSGKVITVEKLTDDDRVIAKKQVQEEGLVTFIGTGMTFEERPIGVIRLYAKQQRRFTAAERRLIRSIGQSAAMAVEQARLLKLKARERRTQRAIKIAAAVQKRMLPERIPRVQGLDMAARFRPSQQIAGDFYDLFDVRDKLGILVGDVVGKGVVAGMLMSAVRATLRAYAELSDDLSRVMERTNDSVCRDTTVAEFVTIWYGVYDPQSRELSYVTAGHEPPILLTPTDGAWHAEPLQGSGLVAGVQLGEEYTMERVTLTPGQVVVAFTDGVMDAVDFTGQRFGRARLRAAIIETLREDPESNADHILERVFWHMRQFTGLQPQVDDETVVVLRAV